MRNRTGWVATGKENLLILRLATLARSLKRKCKLLLGVTPAVFRIILLQNRPVLRFTGDKQQLQAIFCFFRRTQVTTMRTSDAMDSEINTNAWN